MRRLWEAWKRVARKIGDFQARLLLTLCYVLVVAPFALLVRLSADPLSLLPGSSGGWQRRPEAAVPPMAAARRQF